MTFLEWRRFTFFDIHRNVDNGKIAECLQWLDSEYPYCLSKQFTVDTPMNHGGELLVNNDTSMTVATSGNNRVVLCDVAGWAHLISRSWEITSFKAYDLTVSLGHQLSHAPYLVTIGEDETGVTPLIKVWDWSQVDRHGNPKCVRTSRAVPSHMYPTQATALAVHDNKNLLAVGFQDGSITLYRGDITRQRSSKMKTLPDTGSSPITALAFKGADKLFAVSRACVMVCWLNSERCVVLGTMGAAPACSVLTDAQRLTVATTDAIFCYTTEGRGPCYALVGEKLGLNWFRSFLVITTNEISNKASSSSAANKSNHVTVLDIQNKLIVFSKSFDEIDAVLTEWGSFYILTKTKEMIYLEEKDLPLKLSLLFKKNLYDVAIRMASSQHYDAEGLMEIYKQYGDHLYSKGDLKGAIDQYVKTIGWLETSYIIPKYLESRHLEPLVQYLEQLHKKGYATENHTTLLLTCYVKIDQHDQQGKLKEFINSKDKTIDFDVDIALKVVRQVSINDALSLAANHKRHDWYLKIVIEDKKEFNRALDYIADLDYEDADMYMKKYGYQLIQHEPEESTKLLKLLCTDYKPRNQLLVDENSLSGKFAEPDRSYPDDFIHMFLSNSERLVDFLEHMITVDDQCSTLTYNALIEHYIHVWAKSPESDKKTYEQKIITILKNPDANFDSNHILIVCQMLGFKAGILHLYEEKKLWRAQVALHLRSGDAERALGVCRKRGAACPRLWLDVLWAPPPPSVLPEVLHVAVTEKLISPILVIDCLASTPNYTLGDVRKYLMDVLKSEDDVITREQELAVKYKLEIKKMKTHIQVIQNEPLTFQSSRCATCNTSLVLPSLHFLCQHSYHEDCFKAYSESEHDCPACASSGGANRASLGPLPAAEQLHCRLQADHEPFTVVSEYFGRGLFNKVTVVTEPPEPSAALPAPEPAPGPASAPAPVPAQTYGPGAEAKLRLQEGQSKQIFVPNAPKQLAPKGTTVVPVPEGRMRLLEQQQYTSSLEANITRLEPKVHKSPYSSPLAPRKAVPKVSQKISKAIANKGSNPFEDPYDEAKNPFADEDSNDATNPFENDDYDKNLNPFQ